MYTDLAILYIFGAASVVYIVHFGLYLIGANFYDIWQLRRKRALGTNIRTWRPLVSVLVAARNEEKVIERCLRSINQSHYKHLQVIVIDDASTDATSALVRQYKQQHPELSLRLIHRKRNGGKGQALNYALRHYVQGELVMTLDADSIIEPRAIDHAIQYFDDPRIMGVAANVQILDDFTTLGMLQKFEHMISYRSKKTYSLLNCEFVVGGVASTYRMSAMRAVGFYSTDSITEDIGLSMKIVSNGNRSRHLVYGADVVAKTEGVATFRALLKQRHRWKYGSMQNLIKHRHMLCNPDPKYTVALAFYRMPLAVICEIFLLATPILWGYALYIIISQRSLSLFVGAYLTITAYALITLWADEHTPRSQKLLLSIYAPLVYFIFYLMDVVQVNAICRCLYNSRKLWLQKDVGSTWQSPQRIGSLVRSEQL